VVGGWWWEAAGGSRNRENADECGIGISEAWKWCTGEVVQRAAERYSRVVDPWKAREGGRGEMTELAGRCWLVLAGVAGWCSRQPAMRSMIDSVTVTTLRPREPLANQRALRILLSVRAAGAAEQDRTFPVNCRIGIG
jgi:hypothetical protein